MERQIGILFSLNIFYLNLSINIFIMSQNADLIILYNSILRKVLKYPIKKPDDDISMAYSDFLHEIEQSTKTFPQNIFGTQEYYFSSIRYMAYQNWLSYLGYVDNNNIYNAIKTNLDESISDNELSMLADELLGISSHTILKQQNDAYDITSYWCKDNDRFENISKDTLVEILANTLADKLESLIQFIKIFYSEINFI